MNEEERISDILLEQRIRNRIIENLEIFSDIKFSSFSVLSQSLELLN